MASTYSLKEIQKLIDTYTNNPCLETVDRLSVELNRPRRSIISKLVKEGVYITRGYRSKTGETPVSKLALVRMIEDALDTKLPGLDKTPKTTLKVLSKSVVEIATLVEDALEEVQTLNELQNIRNEMLKKSRKNDDPEAILREVKL